MRAATSANCAPRLSRSGRRLPRVPSPHNPILERVPESRWIRTDIATAGGAWSHGRSRSGSARSASTFKPISSTGASFSIAKCSFDRALLRSGGERTDVHFEEVLHGRTSGSAKRPERPLILAPGASGCSRRPGRCPRGNGTSSALASRAQRRAGPNFGDRGSGVVSSGSFDAATSTRPRASAAPVLARDAGCGFRPARCQASRRGRSAFLRPLPHGRTLTVGARGTRPEYPARFRMASHLGPGSAAVVPCGGDV